MGRFSRWFNWTGTQSHRMEAYAVVAALVTIFAFSHSLGYWPYAAQTVSEA
jgi:hypothetical protein